MVMKNVINENGRGHVEEDTEDGTGFYHRRAVAA